MDDLEWNEVKAKPKKKSAAQIEQQKGIQKQQFGGKKKGGKLQAGPVRDAATNQRGMGGPAQTDFSAMSNAASAITEYNDWQFEEFYDEKVESIEKVSTACGHAVAAARAAAKLNQTELAKKIGEKTQVVIDIENGVAPYNGGQINRIEQVLGCKINRARNKK